MVWTREWDPQTALWFRLILDASVGNLVSAVNQKGKVPVGKIKCKVFKIPKNSTIISGLSATCLCNKIPKYILEESFLKLDLVPG